MKRIEEEDMENPAGRSTSYVNHQIIATDHKYGLQSSHVCMVFKANFLHRAKKNFMYRHFFIDVEVINAGGNIGVPSFHPDVGTTCQQPSIRSHAYIRRCS